jgi:hypothetical protein
VVVFGKSELVALALCLTEINELTMKIGIEGQVV